MKRLLTRTAALAWFVAFASVAWADVQLITFSCPSGHELVNPVQDQQCAPAKFILSKSQDGTNWTEILRRDTNASRFLWDSATNIVEDSVVPTNVFLKVESRYPDICSLHTLATWGSAFIIVSNAMGTASSSQVIQPGLVGNITIYFLSNAIGPVYYYAGPIVVNNLEVAHPEAPPPNPRLDLVPNVSLTWTINGLPDTGFKILSSPEQIEGTTWDSFDGPRTGADGFGSAIYTDDYYTTNTALFLTGYGLTRD